jgi:hypothetical protein
LRRSNINSRIRWTVYAQLDSQDGVAISIDLRELIEAGLVPDGFGIIGCNRAHTIVETRGGWAKRSSPRLHYGRFPQQGERRMTKCQRDGRDTQPNVWPWDGVVMLRRCADAHTADEATAKLVVDDVPYKARGQRSTAERRQIGVRLVLQGHIAASNPPDAARLCDRAGATSSKPSAALIHHPHEP